MITAGLFEAVESGRRDDLLHCVCVNEDRFDAKSGADTKADIVQLLGYEQNEREDDEDDDGNRSKGKVF